MELDLVIDVHAHSSLHGVFTYGNAYDDVYRSGHGFVKLNYTTRGSSQTFAKIKLSRPGLNPSFKF